MKDTLKTLQNGDRAVVVAYNTELIPLKLIEMGCVAGAEIQLIKRAPLNDPLYVCVNDSYLAIRKEVAQAIEIKKL